MISQVIHSWKWRMAFLALVLSLLIGSLQLAPFNVKSQTSRCLPVKVLATVPAGGTSDFIFVNVPCDTHGLGVQPFDLRVGLLANPPLVAFMTAIASGIPGTPLSGVGIDQTGVSFPFSIPEMGGVQIITGAHGVGVEFEPSACPLHVPPWRCLRVGNATLSPAVVQVIQGW